ncbi:indole-3-glycerol phosphate synthase TrpC [Tepidibacillus sp. LV47]|uniref:indole-3-glycerol phosphate synthase TrpC n=1 Tax=Tepidibacillus sp. LV47 TaxID=3398228 RepID=UPI003AABAE03
MTILDQIVAKKKSEVAERKKHFPKNHLKDLPFYHEPTVSLKQKLIITSRKVGIIAEMKKASPSKGVLLENYYPEQLFELYQKAEVEGISILTDQPFFQGNLIHLMQVRGLTDSIPLLRKDFIIDPYQIDEAKGYGASVILLISAILEEQQYQELYLQAKELGLEVLTEVHDEEDLEKVLRSFTPEMIGINNRNLKTFQTSIDQTMKMIKKIPKNTIIISESGIHRKEQVDQLAEIGVRGILVGESIVRSKNPQETIEGLVGKK